MRNFISLFFVPFLIVSLNAQTIPNDFKPQKITKKNTINQDIQKREVKAFNNLSHPLSIMGGSLTITGSALYILGSEIIPKKPITDPFLANYSIQNNLQYVGAGVFVAGAVLFAIFSTDRKINVPKRKTKKIYNASEWEITAE